MCRKINIGKKHLDKLDINMSGVDLNKIDTMAKYSEALGVTYREDEILTKEIIMYTKQIATKLTEEMPVLDATLTITNIYNLIIVNESYTYLFREYLLKQLKAMKRFKSSGNLIKDYLKHKPLVTIKAGTINLTKDSFNLTANGVNYAF